MCIRDSYSCTASVENHGPSKSETSGSEEKSKQSKVGIPFCTNLHDSHTYTHTMSCANKTKNKQFRLYWKKSEGRKEIDFGDVPFAVTDAKLYDCQFGVKYFKQRPVQGKRLWLQGSRKVGCAAHVEVKSFVLYPEYAVSTAEKEGLSKWKLRCLYEEKMKQLKLDLATDKTVKVEHRHFVSLPCEEAHSGHPTGEAAGYSQKLNPFISQKISEMVSSDTAEVKRALKCHVDHFLAKELGMHPEPNDRSFYPLNDDIRNHIHKAKRALDLSKLHGPGKHAPQDS